MNGLEAIPTTCCCCCCAAVFSLSLAHCSSLLLLSTCYNLLASCLSPRYNPMRQSPLSPSQSDTCFPPFVTSRARLRSALLCWLLLSLSSLVSSRSLAHPTATPRIADSLARSMSASSSLLCAAQDRRAHLAARKLQRQSPPAGQPSIHPIPALTPTPLLPPSAHRLSPACSGGVVSRCCASSRVSSHCVPSQSRSEGGGRSVSQSVSQSVSLRPTGQPTLLPRPSHIDLPLLVCSRAYQAELSELRQLGCSAHQSTPAPPLCRVCSRLSGQGRVRCCAVLCCAVCSGGVVCVRCLIELPPLVFQRAAECLLRGLVRSSSRWRSQLGAGAGSAAAAAAGGRAGQRSTSH